MRGGGRGKVLAYIRIDKRLFSPSSSMPHNIVLMFDNGCHDLKLNGICPNTHVAQLKFFLLSV